MAGVVAAGAVTDRNSRNTRHVCEQVNASYAEAAKLIDQMRKLQEQKAVLVAKAEQASALQERVPRSYILGTITNACPEKAALLSLQLLSRVADPERMSKFSAVAAQRSGKVPPLFVDLVVTGQAETDVEVARFITNLGRNPLLANVDLVYSEERAGPLKLLYREFQVKMEVKPGVDVLEVITPAAPGALTPAGLTKSEASRGKAPSPALAHAPEAP
jgi:Tfp pilus assembly protein PilN